MSEILEVLMKVTEIMTANPKVCTPASSLSEAAGLMWENDCGILPVVAEDGKVIGLVTDRDICMAAALKNRHVADIAVEEVISGDVVACKADDDVRTALNTMQQNKLHRLPVIADDETLAGILSMNDIVLKAEEAKAAQVSYGDVV